MQSQGSKPLYWPLAAIVMNMWYRYCLDIHVPTLLPLALSPSTLPPSHPPRHHPHRQVYLGGYEDEAAAAQAYDLAVLRSKGPGAITNFPPERYRATLAQLAGVSIEEMIMAVRRQSQVGTYCSRVAPAAGMLVIESAASRQCGHNVPCRALLQSIADHYGGPNVWCLHSQQASASIHPIPSMLCFL